MLGTFKPETRELVDDAVIRASDATELIVQNAIAEAMNKYNSNGSDNA